MRIYIPTLNRAERQVTLRNLPPTLQRQTVLVVNAEDRSSYAHPVIRCPKETKNIGAVRQFICDQHEIKSYGEKLLMLDDDLGFLVRREDDPGKFLPATASDVLVCMKLVNKLLNRYPLVGIIGREGGNYVTEVEVSENTRLLRALAYDVSILRKHNIRFDRIPIMEDFDVALQLLRLGYPNAQVCRFAQGQGSSNAPGGCSTYRTPVAQAAGAKRLAALHSPFVKLVYRTTKTAWGGGTRTDVQIAWKKAFASSQCA